MKIIETIFTAIKSLKTNLIRSMLTTLGVIIGVFSVVLLIALVKGVQNYVQDQFDKLGSNTVFVMPGRSGFSNDPALSFTDNKLDIKNVKTLKSNMGDMFEGVNPHIYMSAKAEYKNKSYYATVDGSDTDLIKVFNFENEKGRFFSEAERNSSARVCLLGSEVNRKLFGESNALKKYITISGKSFEVIGVLKTFAQDVDNEVIMPYTTVKNILGNDKLTYISARFKENTNIDEGIRQMKTALYKDLKRDDFSVMSQKEILSSVQEILGIISIGLIAIAGISLLVGGIGIMNIMLVSVTERISEIGLRKALGATGKNIATQFLLESVFISVIGGIIGLMLAFAGTLIAQQFYRAEIPWWSVVVAMGFSFSVGVIFGTYPAIKASKLDPIEALRFE